jgi:hypothetical protein
MDIIIRCFIKSDAYKKVKFLGYHEKLRKITNPVVDKLALP